MVGSVLDFKALKLGIQLKINLKFKKSAFKKEIAESLIRTYTSAATSYAY